MACDIISTDGIEGKSMIVRRLFEESARDRARDAVEAARERLARDRVAPRIWAREAVWARGGNGRQDVRRVLGWLDSIEPSAVDPLLSKARGFASDLRREGTTDVFVLGMGGSSLAPEVFARMAAPPGAGARTPGRVRVLDTTAPEAVHRALEVPARRLFGLVSSKSGTTTETLALFNVLYDHARTELGESGAGARFAAITDPGTPLERLALQSGFRKVFAGCPEIGGRFSALSAFGLVPAELAGVDTWAVVEGARATAALCRRETAGASTKDGNPGAELGAILGGLAAGGRDKLLLHISPRLPGFGAWIEQLVAESTGKDGKGILPVVLESFDEARRLAGPDRLLVLVTAPGEEVPAEALREAASQMPVFEAAVGDGAGPDAKGDAAALGGQFFLWEFATAVAGYLLDINPFDQPNVESTKVRTREILKAGGGGVAAGTPAAAGESFEPGEPFLRDKDIAVQSGAPGGTLREALADFLDPAGPGSYIAIQAFLDPSPENRERLAKLRRSLIESRGIPVTAGFGPRYLHSTGQLHKGDAGRGLFVQLGERPIRDVAIPSVPGSPAPAPSFGALIAAQGRADAAALRERGRKVLKVEFLEGAEKGFPRFLEEI